MGSKGNKISLTGKDRSQDRNRSHDYNLEVDEIVEGDNSDRDLTLKETGAHCMRHYKNQSLRKQLKKGYQAMGNLNLELAEESLIESAIDEHSAFTEGE